MLGVVSVYLWYYKLQYSINSNSSGTEKHSFKRVPLHIIGDSHKSHSTMHIMYKRRRPLHWENRALVIQAYWPACAATSQKAIAGNPFLEGVMITDRCRFGTSLKRWETCNSPLFSKNLQRISCNLFMATFLTICSFY